MDGMDGREVRQLIACHVACAYLEGGYAGDSWGTSV